MAFYHSRHPALNRTPLNHYHCSVLFPSEYTIWKSLMANEIGIHHLNGKVFKCYAYFNPSHILYHVSFCHYFSFCSLLSLVWCPVPLMWLWPLRISKSQFVDVDVDFVKQYKSNMAAHSRFDNCLVIAAGILFNNYYVQKFPRYNDCQSLVVISLKDWFGWSWRRRGSKWRCAMRIDLLGIHGM